MTATSSPLTGRRTLRGRLAVPALTSLGWLLQRLPDRLLHRLAHAAGMLLWAAQPARRRLVQSNLRRVCRYLAEQGMGGPGVARAATNGPALAGLTRAAFGHYVRAYLEGAILPRYDARWLAKRLAADDPALVEEVLGAPGGGPRRLIMIGMHFGAIEIPARWAVEVRRLALTSPMETVSDAGLQAYFERTRGAAGLRLVRTRGAGRVLAERLAAGEAVAIVADRVVTGSGARVEFFGAPARLPLGPAVLAVDTGAPAWAVAVRRTGWGHYRARLEPVPCPSDGNRRERLVGCVAAQARAFESLIADAPEQWWAIFFPIWQEQP